MAGAAQLAVVPMGWVVEERHGWRAEGINAVEQTDFRLAGVGYDWSFFESR